MKIFFYIIIIFIFLCNNNNLFSQDITKINELIETSDKLISNKRYKETLPIFNELCYRFNIESGCYNLAYFTEFVADNNEDIDKAMNIYKKLEKSKDEGIAIRSKQSLDRMPIYEFIDRYFNLRDNFINDKINFNKFNLEISKLDENILPKKTKNIYLDLKNVLLEKYKLDEDHSFTNSVVKPMIKSGAGNFFDAFSDIADNWKGVFNIKELGDNVNNLSQQFNNSLITDCGISSYWFNSRIKLFNNNIKDK